MGLAGVAYADHPAQGFSTGSSGSLQTVSATTLPAGGFSLGLQLQSIDYRRFSDAALSGYAVTGEHVHGLGQLHSGSLSLAYGVNDDLTVVASLPYISRQDQREAEHEHDDEHEADGGGLPLDLLELLPHEHDEEMPIVRDLGDAAGIGDLSLLGQYRWHNDRTARQQAAWLFGIKAPTGRTDVRDTDGERLETHHQPGSGSWDALIGAAYSCVLSFGALDASLLYTHTGEGSQDTRMGSGLNYNLGISRRLGMSGDKDKTHAHHKEALPHDHNAVGTAASPWALLSWDLILEFNGEWREYEKQHDERVDHTGGHLLYLSPGVRANLGVWSAGLMVGVPIIKDLNGIQSEPDSRLIFSLVTSLN